MARPSTKKSVKPVTRRTVKEPVKLPTSQAEKLQEIKKQSKTISLEELPEILEVYQVRYLLKIGRPAVYRLLDDQEIPVLKSATPTKFPRPESLITFKEAVRRLRRNDWKSADQR